MLTGKHERSGILQLSDGLVLGVDSAVTRSGNQGEVSKVFEDADKLFKLKGSRVGVATYGLAAIRSRTIGSFIREFELTDRNADLLSGSPIPDVVEALRSFFMNAYVGFYEEVFSEKFDKIPDEHKGTLGLIVGGFSPGAFLSEVWQILIPWHSTQRSPSRFYA